VCDFESFLVQVETGGKTGGLSLVDEHKVSGVCGYRVTDFDEYETPPYVYSGPNPMTKFYDHVMSKSREICHIVTSAASMLPLTEKQAAEYARAVSCFNCGEAFSKDNHKTHHHCHISGKYLFPACDRCNLNLKPVTCTSKPSRKRNFTSTDEWAEEQYRQNFFIPVLFHNLKSYDAHFVIKHFQRKYVESRNSNNEVSFDDIKITPLNSEKYLSFQIGNLRFLDSYQFLSTSLKQLVSLLLKAGGGRENFVHTSKHFTHIAI